MIPYDNLCRALNRYRARQRGEEYVENDSAAGYGAGFDVDIEPEGEVAVADDEIIESADAGVYVEEGQYDVGDMTDETAAPPEHVDPEYAPPLEGHEEGAPLPDDQQAGEAQGEGPSGTIYGMPAAPPPPPATEPAPQEGEAPPPPPDDEHRET